MEDIAPVLLLRIRSSFQKRMEESKEIQALYQKIQSGGATYADAEDYAYHIGQALSQAFGESLGSAALPDGRMYYNIADRILRPLLEEDHSIVAKAAQMVQQTLNQQAGIGITAQTAEVNLDRIQGIVDKVSNAEVFDDVAWVLDEPVKNFSMNVVDETIRKNVDFQGKSGLRPKVTRKAERKCCSWCSNLAGEYEYPDVPDDVYRRHDNTMLDNLKLGYGGTKTEMQRLLKDAQALTGVKYDINNLSDVYNAIHVIQDELGVTGTTALEASQTLTGSFNAMKASFTNVLGNLTLGRDITPSLNALVKTTTTFIKGNLIPAVLNILRALPGAAVTLLQALIPGGMQNLTTNIVTNFTTFMTAQFPMLMENGTQMINQMITGFLSGLPSFVATAGSLITQVLTTIAEALPTMLQSGTDILLNLVMGIMTALPSLITTAGQIVQNLLTALMAALPSLLSTGMSFIVNLASGLLASLPNIISSATTVVTNLLTTLASHLPDLLAQGISMIGQLVAGLISMIPDVISAAVDIGRGILNTIGEVDWISLGKNVIDGIINGIKNAAGSLFDALKDLASKALQAAKDALGIASPSRKFRDMVGKFIPAGVAKGVLQNLGLVKSAVRKMSDLAEDDFNASLRMDTRTGRGHSSGGTKGRSGVSVVQYIYSEAKTAADLMREARYQAEMAVLLGV